MFQSVSVRFEPIPVVKDSTDRTVPDMSYTPREIIAKFSRGERVPLGFEGVYDDENSSPFDEDPTRDPDFDHFDYTEEKRALEERNKEREKQKRSKVEAEESSQRKARSEEVSASDPMKSETTSGESPSAPDAQ